MPGIVGIVSKRPAHECAGLIKQMISSMLHEPFYVSGTCHAAELGVYAGWVAHEHSYAEANSIDEEDVSVGFAGECYSDDSRSIAEQYRGTGQQFIAQLNGLFAGLIIDRRSRRAFLFNDRFGFDRIYLAEQHGEIYFASEAKALLAVLPQTRRFDRDGVADFLAFGCATGTRTLFRGISVLPLASIWTFDATKTSKRCYFDVTEWEGQEPLKPADFVDSFDRTIARVIPRYFEGNSHELGVSLTAGLDSRVLLATKPPLVQQPLCYTYDGNGADTLDAKIAATIAAAAGCSHRIIRLEDDFFAAFSEYAHRTVYLTDGAFGVVGAHELYFSEAARELARIRVTGVFGGEIFRGISMFKPLGLQSRLLGPLLLQEVRAREQQSPTLGSHPVTRSAFKEIPWSIYGSIAACRSQLRFRTPYLDNDLVSLAYRMPIEFAEKAEPFEAFVAKHAPALARIPTDMGMLGSNSSVRRQTRKAVGKLTFKLNYLLNDGLPHWASSLDPVFRLATSVLPFVGQHKYLKYRRWFRRELAGYLRTALESLSIENSALWDTRFLEALADEHISGGANLLSEINAVLTLDAVEKSLFSTTRSQAVANAA